MSQSSNDTFPTAMHISAVLAVEDKVLPAIDELVATFRRLEDVWSEYAVFLTDDQ